MASTTPPKTNLFGSLGNKNDKGASVNGVGAGASKASSWFEEDDELLHSHLLLDDDHGEELEDLDGRLERLRGRLEGDLIRILDGSDSSGGGGDGWWNKMVREAKDAGFDCSSSSSTGSSAGAGGAFSSSSASNGEKELPKSFHTPEGQAHLCALVDLLGITKERAVKITLASLRTFASAAAPTATTNTPTTSTSSGGADSDKENDAEDNEDSNPDHSEQESKLRSLLGTTELFHRVLVNHRRQFLARLRVLTESLRLEQEGKADDEAADNSTNNAITTTAAAGGVNAGENSASKSCSQFLDTLDSKSTLNGKKRGLFHLLLRLATGPPLPGMGARELPHSVSKLRGRGPVGGVGGLGGASSGNDLVLQGSVEILLAIRHESAEALLVLLYDRIDGGAQRCDLWMVMEAASKCNEFEFGMTSNEYSSRGAMLPGAMMLLGGRRGVRYPRQRTLGDAGAMDLEGEMSNPAMIVEQTKCRLDGLWALICAECMGLWRTNSSNNNNNGGSWVEQHPLFSGLTLTNTSAAASNSGLYSPSRGKRGADNPSLQGFGGGANTCDANGQSQKELEALCQTMRRLGESVNERRRAAYNARKRNNTRGGGLSDANDGSQDVQGDGDVDDDDELWGVQTPEAIALLSLGLLLRLAHLSLPHNEFLQKIGAWGGELAHVANDECGAFAYLHRVLEGMIKDPLRERSRRGSLVGGEGVVQNLLSRGEFESAVESGPLALTQDGMQHDSNDSRGNNDDDAEENDLINGSDASSVVYASIGREILSSTIKAFRSSLLTLRSRASAVENVGMLADLASVIYANSNILCEGFWMDWEDFCTKQQSGGNDGMEEDGTGGDGELKDGEPMCFLLDVSHTLAVSTLEELKSVVSSQHQQPIIHYLKPLSTFLRLIASLSASPAMVRSVLTSEFLPDGLVSSAMSVVATLAPLVSSLVEGDGHQVSSEERSTIRYATEVVRSISTLAYLGGREAKAWIRSSFSGLGGPRMLCGIASEALPRGGVQDNHASFERECTALATSSLNLLVDLLADADSGFQTDTMACFSSTSLGSFGGDRMSGFAPYVMAGGTHGEITVAAMTVLNCLAVNLTRNVFDPQNVSLGKAATHIETIGGGVMVGLDMLSTLALSGEVSFPLSRAHVSATRAVLSSVVSTLVSLKQIIYLHEDDDIRGLALGVRNDIINCLASSTSLGQVVAFLASAPVSLGLMKNTSKSKELVAVMDSAADGARYGQNNQDNSKYGAWGRFVTPKRALQKAASRRKAAARVRSAEVSSDILDGAKDDAYSDELYDVVVMALSLLLVWGQHAEDIADNGLTITDGSPLDEKSLLQRNGPCNLLLSRACPSAIQPHASSAAAVGGRTLNVANLNLISRLTGADDVLAGGTRSDAALLSARIVKMCLRQYSTISQGLPYDAGAGSIGLSAFRSALGGGEHMFRVLLDAFGKIDGGGGSSGAVYFDGMERLVLLTSILLEAVAVGISSQPDLARDILLGGQNKEDWALVDRMVSCIVSTSELMSASRGNPGTGDERILSLRSLLTCSTLYAVSELWKSCRLTTTSKKKNSSSMASDSVHACGTIVAHLSNMNDKDEGAPASLVANLIVELTRCSLLAIMSLEEKNSMQDEVSTVSINQKSVLLDLLSRSLDLIAIETASRVQTKSQGGIKFVEDLFDQGPMECWKVLLASSDAPASAASSWLSGFSSVLGRRLAPNWNIASFLCANQPDDALSTSVWCSFGSAVGLTNALLPLGSTSGVDHAFRQCNALHVLSQGEASFAASWATFFEVVTANVFAACRDNREVYELTNVLAESALLALSSIAESKMMASSVLSSQGLLQSRETKPVGELCSLLLYSLTVRGELTSEHTNNSQTMLEMIERLYEASNKIFVMTQLGSVAPANQESVCLIRQKLMTSALILLSEFESLPKEGVPHDDVVKYKDLRIGFTNLAVNVLQSLQYAQMGTDDAGVAKDTFAPSKYSYGFGAVSENSGDTTPLGQEAALQLLRTSLSLLSHLAPTPVGSSSTKLGNKYQTYSYGVDFAACLKERNALNIIQYHLGTASTVASLTYQPVHAGSSTHAVAVIHNNAVDVVRLITTFIHSMTDSGATIVGILLLLTENRCFRSLIDNPLLKTSCKTWTANSGTSGQEVMPGVTRHRGYYTSFPQQAASTSTKSKARPSSRKDLVHSIWREVISIFSSLLRSVRCQVQVYAKVDEHIQRQLAPATSTVLDFVYSYQEALFSCFSSMLSEARAQKNLSSKGNKAKSSSFSSSIQSSTFAFTPNLLEECADISSLFAELCKGDVKNEVSHQCGDVYQKLVSSSLDLTKFMSTFLGSIGNARELFFALSSCQVQGPTSMFDAHPLLADGIPNARHDALRNSHFAHSCCILATAEDFSNSHLATTTPVETSGRDKSLEQSFQIYVNNKFIADAEQVAGQCLFNALSVLSDTHPASDSFVSFSTEEASQLDVSAVISPGTMVAILLQRGSQQFQRYRPRALCGNVQYARTLGCDRSTRTISVEYCESGSVERHVPWSCIIGMEDTSRRDTVFSFAPIPKSIADADSHGQPTLGHLMLSLKWCRQLTTSLDNPKNCPIGLIKCVAERAAIMLCTEVMLHDELRDRESRDDTARKVNMQLLDLFEYIDTESTGLRPAPLASNQQCNNLALAIGEDILGTIQKNLKRQLQAAFNLREEEQKIWEQNNTGWDNTSFWGSSTKRQGRRSPFRLVRKNSSSGD